MKQKSEVGQKSLVPEAMVYNLWFRIYILHISKTLLFFLLGEIGHELVKAQVSGSRCQSIFDFTHTPNAHIYVKREQTTTLGVFPYSSQTLCGFF